MNLSRESGAYSLDSKITMANPFWVNLSTNKRMLHDIWRCSTMHNSWWTDTKYAKQGLTFWTLETLDFVFYILAVACTTTSLYLNLYFLHCICNRLLPLHYNIHNSNGFNFRNILVHLHFSRFLFSNYDKWPPLTLNILKSVHLIYLVFWQMVIWILFGNTRLEFHTS